ncbi:MAG: aminotransferase class I/II-fold pyridoxal phosphate-dependent enzyme [Thermoanaerobaculia bacterium]
MSRVVAGRMASLGTENAFRLGVDIQRCVDRGMDVVRLNLGEPDFDSPEHVNRAAIDAILAGDSHYCDPAGLPELRQAVAETVSETRGLAVGPDRVVVTPGAKPPIGYSFLSYVEPGDEVVYPSPGFPIYESWAGFVGATPRPLRLSEESGFAFTADQLAACLSERTKLVILCSPSNPTGGVLPRELLAEVAEVVRDRCRPEVRVYSDEIYEDILFDGETHHSVASLPGMEERTIVVSGMSKGFAMTGWRLGYAVLPTAEEALRFKQLNINTVSCVPPFVQRAGIAALDRERSEPAVAEMVAAFQRRRDWVVPALSSIDGVRCENPKGAFYVFPNVEGVCRRLGIFEAYSDLTEEARARTSPSGMLQMFLLYRHGVATMDRNSFGKIGAADQHFLRLSIATSLERLQEGVRRLERAAADAGGFAAFLTEEGLWARA